MSRTMTPEARGNSDSSISSMQNITEAAAARHLATPAAPLVRGAALPGVLAFRYAFAPGYDMAFALQDLFRQSQSFGSVHIDLDMHVFQLDVVAGVRRSGMLLILVPHDVPGLLALAKHATYIRSIERSFASTDAPSLHVDSTTYSFFIGLRASIPDAFFPADGEAHCVAALRAPRAPAPCEAANAPSDVARPPSILRGEGDLRPPSNAAPAQVAAAVLQCSAYWMAPSWIANAVGEASTAAGTADTEESNGARYTGSRSPSSADSSASEAPPMCGGHCRPSAAAATDETATAERVAVKVALEGVAVRTFRCPRRLKLSPKPGDALLVRLRDGSIRAGQCVSVAVWSPNRQSRGSGGSGDVLRRMTAADVAHLNTVVQPLANEVLAMARRMVAERGVAIDLVSASCFFDCGTVLILMRRKVSSGDGPTNSAEDEVGQTCNIAARIADEARVDHTAVSRCLGSAAQPASALRVIWNRVK